ncbi:MAG: DUF971 domain-containing protein [Planctomycetes bacterium]|nr:DUF971 domain-containing protein [Planctomycetota bacterium]
MWGNMMGEEAECLEVAARRPLELDLDRSSALRVTWADGHKSVYPLRALRRSCPCASCRGEREARAQNPLHVIQGEVESSAMTNAESAELVGNYALQIRWCDEHDSGIYEFSYLRSLCPCDACGKYRSSRNGVNQGVRERVLPKNR